MSDISLSPEILDHTVDLLHDDPETLKECCLASKSWVPRARKHLFANIVFRSAAALRSWKDTFPDSTDSPAHHARTLVIHCPDLVVASDAEEGGWIRAFSGVANLGVYNDNWYSKAPVSLAPFRGFSPTLKSLRIFPITLPCPELFDLIRSSPLLEDLFLRCQDKSSANDDGPHEQQAAVRSTSPMLTGTLDLDIIGGIRNTARQLLDLPGGLRFRGLVLTQAHKEDFRWILELVARCSDTLERLSVTFNVSVEPGSALIDLSNATKLKDVGLGLESRSVGWIVAALETITPEHRDLRRISIYVPYHLTLLKVGTDIRRDLGEVISKGWSDLDRLLVRLWESHSIRLRVSCALAGGRQNTEYCIGCLLPEITERGIIEPL